MTIQEKLEQMKKMTAEVCEMANNLKQETKELRDDIDNIRKEKWKQMQRFMLDLHKVLPEAISQGNEYRFGISMANGMMAKFEYGTVNYYGPSGYTGYNLDTTSFDVNVISAWDETDKDQFTEDFMFELTKMLEKYAGKLNAEIDRVREERSKLTA